MEKDVKQKALDIIQSYQGPRLRIMEVCEPIPMRFSVWESAKFCLNRLNSSPVPDVRSASHRWGLLTKRLHWPWSIRR